ncbi:type II toxin-antitoxin system RelE/ParE family toxin [Thermodesulfovibrionales bacterium]|nr:type II toxin-antitoxin system RelE/ParE family toxin [Thermodesulfovibrionales bacterium]
MEIRFLKIAQVELDEAVEYYNVESPGLGDEFLLEVLDVIKRIRQFPVAWHPFTEKTRRCQTRRFPYGVIYQILETEIVIGAVAHLHRKPDYWYNRI